MPPRPPAPSSQISVKTKSEIDSEQAQAAWRRGEDLLDAGDAAGALTWLERAERIAPGDETVALSLARALLALDDPRATVLFDRLAQAHDVREVWLGLALAHLRVGATGQASAALAASLARHRCPAVDEMAYVAHGIAAQASAPGWCALRDDDTLLIRPAEASRAPEIIVLADGRKLRGGRVPQGIGSVSIMLAGRHLLGSPIRVDRIRRVEGFVTARDGGIEGWAWLPGDAGHDPVLTIEAAAGGGTLSVVATDTDMLASRPLSRPRRFALGAADLAGLPGKLRIRGEDGRQLTGSPLDPGLEIRAAANAATALARALPVLGPRRRGEVPWLPTPAALVSAPASAPSRPRRRVAVVVPVYRGVRTTLACLNAVFATVPDGTVVIVVNDASPEPELHEALTALAGRRRVRLIRHARNLGFPAAANAGLQAAAALPKAADVVLLNSDTVPTPGWLDRLRSAIHAAPDIGTACPISNDATILSYPDPAEPAPPLHGAALAAFAALAAEVHGDAAVDVPTAVGFCMYIRRECLLQCGLLRDDVFGQGYGEENDFCLRARHLGWRHVAVPGAYVSHIGAASFGDARAHLRDRNLDVLERLHPGYRALIADWQAADPLAGARRALDAARWATRSCSAGGSVVVVTHDSGGGVERALRARCAALADDGLDAIVLRPVVDPSGTAARRYVPGLCSVGAGQDGGFPNLRFRLPEELPALAALLERDRPRWLEVHHLLGHHYSVTDLATALRIPYEIRVHDYSMICARINLIGAERRYCGEPSVAACDACVADAGSALEETIEPRTLRQRSAAALSGARAVIVPSEDTASRLRRYFPAAKPLVLPHEDDAGLPPLAQIGPPPRRIGVVGAIGVAKGYDTLLACARDAARRDLALSFTVIGHTEDDERLLATGRVFITGPYAERNAVTLIRQHGLHLAWLPSIWPETWCYALGEAMRAGLAVAVFDIGAQAERIRRTGRGWCLPLGLSTPAINNALLALQTVAGDECAGPAVATVGGELVTSNLRSLTARS